MAVFAFADVHHRDMKNTPARRARSGRVSRSGRSQPSAPFLAWLFTALLSATLAACGAVDSESVATLKEPIAGANAAGVIPAGLPAQLMVGLFENPGKTWMKSSGVPWQMRYQYFIKGWVDNFGWGAPDGSLALSTFQES